MNNSKQINTKKLPLIQVFRGLAALLVVVYHISDRSKEFLNKVFLWDIFTFGHSGVDFFFVLSGFIIFYVHRKDFGKPDRFSEFTKKRFIRIYPIYFIITILILPIYLLGYGKAYKTDFWVVLKSFLLLPQNKDVFPIVNVGWTLSYECLFYLLFGLAILIRPKLTKLIVIAWVSGIFYLIIYNLAGFYPHEDVFLNFLFSFRNLEFLLGCFIGSLVLDKHAIYPVFLLILGVVLFLAFGFGEHLFFSKENVVYSVLGYGSSSALIILASAQSDIQKPANPSRLLLFIGDASYSIYLTHYSVFTGLMLASMKFKLTTIFEYHFLILTIFVFTIALGSLVYIFIEKPLLIFFRRILFSEHMKKNV